MHIREVNGGGICLAGAHEMEVGSKDEMATLLDRVISTFPQGSSGVSHKEYALHMVSSIALALYQPRQEDSTQLAI